MPATGTRTEEAGPDDSADAHAGQDQLDIVSTPPDVGRVEAVRKFEPVAAHELSVGHQSRGGAVGHHPAAIEDHRSRAQLESKRKVVGDHDLGGFHAARRATSSRRPAGSRFEVGSSSTRISGFIASTVAIDTRRRSPPDR